MDVVVQGAAGVSAVAAVRSRRSDEMGPSRGRALSLLRECGLGEGFVVGELGADFDQVDREAGGCKGTE